MSFSREKQKSPTGRLGFSVLRYFTAFRKLPSNQARSQPESLPTTQVGARPLASLWRKKATASIPSALKAKLPGSGKLFKHRPNLVYYAANNSLCICTTSARRPAFLRASEALLEAFSKVFCDKCA